MQRASQQWVEVDRYIAERLLGDAPAIDRGDLPPAEVSPPQGALLELLARLAGARAILEIGTLAGYSTAWLARALPPGGRLVTLEADPRARRGRAPQPRRPAGVEVIAGPALETLPGSTGPFDLVFIDADKRSNAEYLRWALRLSRPGTLIVADNVVRGGAVADASSDDPSVVGVRAFFDARRRRAAPARDRDPDRRRARATTALPLRWWRLGSAHETHNRSGRRRGGARSRPGGGDGRGAEEDHVQGRRSGQARQDVQDAARAGPRRQAQEGLRAGAQHQPAKLRLTAASGR